MITARRLRRLWWQLRYLRPQQVVQRLHLRLRPPGQLARVAVPGWQAPSGTWAEPAALPATWREEGVFSLLGSDVPWSAGTVWRDRTLGKKCLMELNTCNWLLSAGPAWRCRLLEDWVAAQRQPDGSGWHPYITSQRIVNWLKSGLAGDGLSAPVRLSLAQQLRYLEPRLGFDECDHKLINNAKALLFAGFCLADPRAPRWRARGLGLLSRYLPGLLHSDGGYVGRSPMYHNALLLDLLDIVNLLRAFRAPLPAGLEARATAALHWSRALCHADSQPALFNDAALDVVPDTPILTAYGGRLGLRDESGSGEIGSCWLPASGVGRLRA
ncbi:MAG: heparinase II/III family protein, partial [Haliea sp.]|uniref:heparinase II/III family protein n=1 Tax=Haliea sp. TaxID=1932666 RepID=UPI0032EEE855